MMLQILEDGRLTDAQGRTISFVNTIIIATSNIGSEDITRESTGIGFSTPLSSRKYEEIKDRVMRQVKNVFKPELLNRIDDLIVFHQLEREHIRRIVDLSLTDLSARLAEQDLAIQVTDAVKDKLAEDGYDPVYGDRIAARERSRRPTHQWRAQTRRPRPRLPPRGRDHPDGAFARDPAGLGAGTRNDELAGC
jgi:ATP-dependent Clp protease ATP-binding subunit ClpC